MNTDDAAEQQLGITVDCRDPRRLAEFWAVALDYVPAAPPSGWTTWDAFLADHGVPPEEWNDGATLESPKGTGPIVTFLRVPEPKVAKNRIHLDLKVSGGRAVDQNTRDIRIRKKQRQLLEHGATTLFEDLSPGHLDHVVMQDPEGNEFCVV